MKSEKLEVKKVVKNFTNEDKASAYFSSITTDGWGTPSRAIFPEATRIETNELLYNRDGTFTVETTLI